MRSSDEQLNDVLNKARKMIEKKKKSRRVLASGALTVFFLALIGAASYMIPRVGQDNAGAQSGVLGSLILSSPYWGYVVIGVFSFALGISLTLFCLRLGKEREEKNDAGD